MNSKPLDQTFQVGTFVHGNTYGQPGEPQALYSQEYDSWLGCHDPVDYHVSYGQSMYDAAPINVELHGWEQFCAFIENHRHPLKGKLYISNAFVGNIRKKVRALDRNWLPMDMDGAITDDVFMELLGQLQDYEYIGHETHSSNPNARKARFFFPLTKLCDPLVIATLGYHLQTKVANNDLYKWDKSVYRPGQPVYLPSPKVGVFRNHGKVIDVQVWLCETPMTTPKPKRFIAPVKLTKNAFLPFDFFKNNGLLLNEKSDHFEVVCPWADLHTDGRLEAAYYPPSTQNNHAGGFKCLHAHCEDKSIRDIYNMIGNK